MAGSPTSTTVCDDALTMASECRPPATMPTRFSIRVKCTAGVGRGRPVIAAPSAAADGRPGSRRYPDDLFGVADGDAAGHQQRQQPVPRHCKAFVLLNQRGRRIREVPNFGAKSCDLL